MSTRNLPGGGGGELRPARKAEKPYRHLWADCLDKMSEPRSLTNLWAFTACYRGSFTFLHIIISTKRRILWLMAGDPCSYIQIKSFVYFFGFSLIPLSPSSINIQYTQNLPSSSSSHSQTQWIPLEIKECEALSISSLLLLFVYLVFLYFISGSS
jgi:hypothetical protein